MWKVVIVKISVVPAEVTGRILAWQRLITAFGEVDISFQALIPGVMIALLKWNSSSCVLSKLLQGSCGLKWVQQHFLVWMKKFFTGV